MTKAQEKFLKAKARQALGCHPNDPVKVVVIHGSAQSPFIKDELPIHPSTRMVVVGEHWHKR